MFISPAYAQAAEGGGASGLVSLLPLILIFVVFYFLLIRPQQKKMKFHRDMLAGIRRGDKVVTNGGIVGTVTKVVGDDELMVEIAEGIRVRVRRGMIAETIAKSEPVRKGAAKDDDDETDEAEGDEPEVKEAKEAKPGSSSLKSLLGGKKSD